MQVTKNNLTGIGFRLKRKARQIKSKLKLRSLKIRKHFSGKMKNKPNIILISIDTLRADHLSCYGYRRKTSPNIDTFAEKSLVFTNAISTSSWTVPAHASMFTGLYPSRHGLMQSPQPGKLPETIKTLAEILGEFGYFTAGFHGGGYLSSYFGFNRGFDVYSSKGSRIEHNLNNCLRWINRHRKDRFFLFLHGSNCHVPLSPPKEFDIYSLGINAEYNTNRRSMYSWEKPKTNEELEYIVAKYDGEIRYMDHLIAKLIDEITRLKIIDNTIIILTADHGEEFMEHGQIGHIRTLYEELIHIPLIVSLPDGYAAKSINRPVSLVNIVPTVLDILQIRQKNNLDGRSLLPFIENGNDDADSLVISETGKDPHKKIGDEPPREDYKVPEFIRSARTKDWKLILDKNDNPIELYNLLDDKNERHNRINDNLPAIAEAKLKLENMLKELGLRSFKDDLANTDSEDYSKRLKEQLMNLGYL